MLNEDRKRQGNWIHKRTIELLLDSSFPAVHLAVAISREHIIYNIWKGLIKKHLNIVFPTTTKTSDKLWYISAEMLCNFLSHLNAIRDDVRQKSWKKSRQIHRKSVFQGMRIFHRNHGQQYHKCVEVCVWINLNSPNFGIYSQMFVKSMLSISSLQNLKTWIIWRVYSLGYSTWISGNT